MFLPLALAACSSGRGPFTSDADRSAYPAGPHGLEVGDTIANYALAEPDGTVRVQDLRSDPRDRLLVVFAIQTWPNACASEADHLARVYDDYQRRGVDVLGVLVEDFETAPTAAGARAYFEILHDAPYRYAAAVPDADPSFGADLDRRGLVASPMNLVVDLDTMEITAAVAGWSREELESHLHYSL